MVSCFCLLLIMIVMRLIYHSLDCCGRVLRRQTLQSGGGHDKNAGVRFLLEKRGDATAAFASCIHFNYIQDLSKVIHFNYIQGFFKSCCKDLMSHFSEWDQGQRIFSVRQRESAWEPWSRRFPVSPPSLRSPQSQSSHHWSGNQTLSYLRSWSSPFQRFNMNTEYQNI